MRAMVLASILVLTGCASELAGHTANIGLALTQVEQGNIYRNVAASFEDRDFVPIPYILQEGTATLNDDISTGISPNISLIGRAITGFKLDGGLTFQRTFKIKPQDGLSNRLRARELFRHAICHPKPEDGCQASALEQAFQRLGSVGPRGLPVQTSDGLTEAIITLVGDLPPGPFIFRDAPCVDRNLRDYIDGHFYCFKDQHARSQFTLWLAAVTQDFRLPGDEPPTPIPPAPRPRTRLPGRPVPNEPTIAPSFVPNGAPQGRRLEQRESRSSGISVEPLINQPRR
ncbi:hypothetical protein [Muricoccus aerilatus]|uniref:hypothetical protein n=1 Tax=Muricoccus aerilatus TaxID=452982 RepID=UPI001470457E|nr:hypothetical protein [Roseomonas aerilata]